MSRLHEVKLVLVGETNVGKTSLVSRYLYNKFSTHSATIAAQFMIKVITIGGQSYKLQIWDTAGQERFRAMAPLYYRNADVAVVVCDVEQHQFSSSVDFWINQLHKSTSDDLVIAVCVNKSDLEESDWTITRQDLADLVERSNADGADVFVTSAKQNKGVHAMFQAAIEKSLSRRTNVPSDTYLKQGASRQTASTHRYQQQQQAHEESSKQSTKFKLTSASTSSNSTAAKTATCC